MEQLELVRVMIALPQLVLWGKKPAYSDDLGQIAAKIAADVWFCLAKKNATARPYFHEQRAVLLTL